MGKPKLGTILLSVALVGAIGAAVFIFLQKNKEEARRVWVEDQLKKLKTAKAALEQERDELNNVKQTLETQLADVNTQVKKLTDDLAAEKRSRETIASELAKAKAEASSLVEKMKAVENEKKTVSDDLARAKQSYQALSNELTTLRQAKEALEKRVKEMLTSSSSETIVVKPPASMQAPASAPAQPAPAPADGPEGKILVVNKEFNFVVVNLGSRDGLQNGTRLDVLRGGKKIGSAQVERLYENMSAATVLVEEQKGQMKEGDAVQVVS